MYTLRFLINIQLFSNKDIMTEQVKGIFKEFFMWGLISNFSSPIPDDRDPFQLI